MSLKEQAMKDFQEKMSSNENIQGMISTYYEMESGISGHASSTPMRGILAYTERQLLFYSEIFGKLPISLQIPYSKIHEIKEKKQSFALFKTIPVIAVFHQEQEIFTTLGNEEEFIRLQAFFEKIKLISTP
ncbi:GRAM domain-containing protein [Bacillus pseudomycoides]|uniref:GRAM domain-containing protein n=1 Tax=Bacillus pseudomycoides TaxID=64104 RepID=UPI003D1F5CE0